MLVRLVIGLLAALFIALPTASSANEAVFERGRACVTWFDEGKLDQLHRVFSETMKSAFPLDHMIAFRQQMAVQAGVERELLEERVEEQGGLDVYIRRVMFEHMDSPMDIIVALNGMLEVEGFLITNAPVEHESEYLDYEPVTRLSLPFEGEWTVFWGGRTVEENYHAAHRDQRFALDLVITEDNLTHRDDGSANEHYYCFDAPLFAPAAGEVVAAVDGVPDNVPGEMNADSPLGNYVILDHGHDEYSVLAHFKQGTVAVKAGDRVEAGAELGRCGNSGNSSEPHLHLHVQNGPTPFDADGLPARFCDFYIDDEATTCAEPRRGQRIRR